MFEALKEFCWSKMYHAYGTSEEVPKVLPKLLSESTKDREYALSYFWSNMLHQGSRYEATPSIARFLFEALESPKCSIHDKIIDLILAIGVGYAHSFLPYGYDLEKEEINYQNGSHGGLFFHSTEHEAYYEVNKKCEQFIPFLNQKFSKKTRYAAGFAIPHFAQTLSSYHPKIKECILEEKFEKQIYNLLLCYGILGRFANKKPEADFLLSYIAPSRLEVTRVCASIALLTIFAKNAPEIAVKTLDTALKESWDLSSFVCLNCRSWMCWNEGNLNEYAILVLNTWSSLS